LEGKDAGLKELGAFTLPHDANRGMAFGAAETRFGNHSSIFKLFGTDFSSICLTGSSLLGCDGGSCCGAFGNSSLTTPSLVPTAHRPGAPAFLDKIPGDETPASADFFSFI
jgi:hypothetical protein